MEQNLPSLQIPVENPEQNHSNSGAIPVKHQLLLLYTGHKAADTIDKVPVVLTLSHTWDNLK